MLIYSEAHIALYEHVLCTAEMKGASHYAPTTNSFDAAEKEGVQPLILIPVRAYGKALAIEATYYNTRTGELFAFVGGRHESLGAVAPDSKGVDVLVCLMTGGLVPRVVEPGPSIDALLDMIRKED